MYDKLRKFWKIIMKEDRILEWNRMFGDKFKFILGIWLKSILK